MSGVRFIYIPATDLDAMRAFYTDRVGLVEIYFARGESVAYDCDGLQFTVMAATDVKVAEGWATQPGWRGKTSPQISWSVELSEAEFRAAVAATHGVDTTLHEIPRWVGYWSYPVKDPMGNTVELTWPAEKPQLQEWQPHNPW